MSDSENEWGFFVDLENYSKLPASKPFYRYIPETKLYTIQESEEIYYNSELKEAEENIYSNSELKENAEPKHAKEKVQYYVSLGIMLSGFVATIVLAYYDII
jgi:hypothetical protein